MSRTKSKGGPDQKQDPEHTTNYDELANKCLDEIKDCAQSMENPVETNMNKQDLKRVRSETEDGD